jgi:preprotein translocase subunit SecB
LHDNNLTGTNYKISPVYYKRINQITENSYTFELELKIENTEENPFPININIAYETTFSFKNFQSEKEIKDFLNIAAVQLIFPFIRTALNSLLSAAILPPIILPPVDVKMFKEKK